MESTVRLNHVGISVPDAEITADYYERFLGQAITSRQGRNVIFMSGRPGLKHHELSIFKDTPKLRHNAFEVDSISELRQIREGAVAAGVPIEMTVDRGSLLSVLFRDPDGNLVEACWTTGSLAEHPNRPLDLSLSDDAILAQVAASDPKGTETDRPRLGHIAVYSPQPALLADWYCRLLGFQPNGGGSHPVAGEIRFVKSPVSDWDHEVAFLSNPQMAHHAFEVASLADLKQLNAKAKASGTRINMEVTHGISLSFYSMDPAGNQVEIYWRTGLAWPQPFAEPIDLSLPEEDLMERVHGAATATT